MESYFYGDMSILLVGSSRTMSEPIAVPITAQGRHARYVRFGLLRHLHVRAIFFESRVKRL